MYVWQAAGGPPKGIQAPVPGTRDCYLWPKEFAGVYAKDLEMVSLPRWAQCCHRVPVQGTEEESEPEGG